MAENDVYTASFNEEFRQEFVNCVNVMDFIMALGDTLTNIDEQNIKAVYDTRGNTDAAICLCEKLCRRQNWKERILKALRSDNIRQDDLAEKMDKKFRDIEAATKKTSCGSLDSDTYQDHFNRLKQNITLLNLKIRKNVSGDGNCFFYCVQDQLERLRLPSRSVATMRTELVDFLQKLDEEDPLKDIAHDDYLEMLKKDGTWVDAVAVRGMARILNRNMSIVTSQKRSTEMGYFVNEIKENSNSKDQLLLGLIGESHYISLGNVNSPPFPPSHGNTSNFNQDMIGLKVAQSPEGNPSVVLNFNVNLGARPKENTQVFIDYNSPTSNSANFGRLATNFPNAPPTFPEKDMSNIGQLTKYEEELVADAIDREQKNVLIIVPNEDETRSKIPAHICTTHLQDSPRGDGMKKRKAVCLTTSNRMNLFRILGKYMPRTVKIDTILDDQKNITAESLKRNDVIISTAEVFERALTSEVVTFSDITLLILDECQSSCQTGHPYRSIMKTYLTGKLADNSALPQVVGLTTSGVIQGQGETEKTADNLSNLIGTLDAMCISTVKEEATKKELYAQLHPKLTQVTVVERRQDDPFCNEINKMMEKIEKNQNLDDSVESLQRHSEEYGYLIKKLSQQEKEKKNQEKEKEETNERVVFLEHLAVYNKVLQLNEIMRARDAFTLLKKFYKEHDDDDKWLDDLYQENSSQLYKLSKEGENPRLAQLKRAIFDKLDDNFKAIIISEHHQAWDALRDWLNSSPEFKNLKTQSLSITGKSRQLEIESFNAGNTRLLLTSSTGLKDAKLVGVKMAVIFGSIMDGIHIFQSGDDVTEEVLGLVAEQQFDEVVKCLQDIPESVRRKNNLEKKLQILRESEEVKEQNISKKNRSKRMGGKGLGGVKDIPSKRYSFDTNVSGQACEETQGDKSEEALLASSLSNIKSKGNNGEEKDLSAKSLPLAVNMIGKANKEGQEKTSTKDIASKCYTFDVNVEHESQLSKFNLYCRGPSRDEKCNTNTVVCSLSKIRLKGQANHVYNQHYWEWNKITVKEHPDKEKRKFKTKKIYCKKCGADWGNTFQKHPCLKLKSFLVELPSGEKKAFSQWTILEREFKISIPPMD